jgi:hypothetical protein
LTEITKKGAEGEQLTDRRISGGKEDRKILIDLDSNDIGQIRIK